jgi:hypothetical protein
MRVNDLCISNRFTRKQKKQSASKKLICFMSNELLMFTDASFFYLVNLYNFYDFI